MALIETIPVKEDYRRKMAYQLMKEASDASTPIVHWAQGLAKLGQGALGGYQMYQADQRDKETEAGNNAALIAALQGGSASPVAPAAMPAQPTPQQPTARPPMPVSSVTPSAGAVPAALSGARPGGPVMPSNKVWGDAEAEAAGLYEKPGQPQIAANGPVALPPAAPPAAVSPAAVPSPTEPQMTDAKARLVQMLQSDNPQMRKIGQNMAQAMLTNQLQGDKPTDEIREYQFAQKNPGFVDYKTNLKKAGATNVSVDTKGENSFATEAGKSQAKRFDELAGEGQKARQMVSDINTLTELGKNIGTGKSAELKAALGPYAENLGIKIDGLSDIQAFEAITNRVAPSLRVPGSGAQSDYELKNFLKSLPALGNTPEGNAISAATMKGLQENKIRASEIGSKALNGEISRPQAEKMLRELPDPMDGYREYMKANRGAPTAAGAAKAAPAVPRPGEIKDGYRFKGGNPGDPKSWEQIS
jgi:hypothetical protein